MRIAADTAVPGPVAALLSSVISLEVVPFTAGGVTSLVQIIIKCVLWAGKSHFLLIQFLFDECLCVAAEFWQLHFLLLYYERWNVPLAELLVPLRLALDLVHLLVVHQESDDLLVKVQFFGLLANRF